MCDLNIGFLLGGEVKDSSLDALTSSSVANDGERYKKASVQVLSC